MFSSKRLINLLANYDNERSYGYRFRKKRIELLFPLIRKAYRLYGKVSIIDVGGEVRYWKIVDDSVFNKYNIHITIANPNLSPNSLTTKDDHFNIIPIDGCYLNIFKDESFHIGHSNSVIEHVGDWIKMSNLAREIKRVSKSYFVQTPNYWFPIEPHCLLPMFHWLPKPLRITLILNHKLGHWDKASSVHEAVLTVESARLLNKKMFSTLFDNAIIHCERFFGLTKSLIAIKY